MAASCCGDSSCRAATSDNEPEFSIINENNLPDRLFQSLQANISPCNMYDFENNKFYFDNISSHLIIHLNISSLQAHFDELHEFLHQLPSLPSIIFLSETRINLNPTINIEIPGYVFVHLPSPTKAGGVGAYLSKAIKFSKKDNLQLHLTGCEDLWLKYNFLAKKIIIFSQLFTAIPETVPLISLKH